MFVIVRFPGLPLKIYWLLTFVLQMGTTARCPDFVGRWKFLFGAHNQIAREMGMSLAAGIGRASQPSPPVTLGLLDMGNLFRRLTAVVVAAMLVALVLHGPILQGLSVNDG